MSKKINLEILDDLYKNIQTTLQTISVMSSSTKDAAMLSDLSAMHDECEKQAGEIATVMLENNLAPKEPNIMKKAIVWGGIKITTIANDSNSNIADMLIKGAVMSANQLTQLQNENMHQLDQTTKDLIGKLIALQEKYAQDFKKHL